MSKGRYGIYGGQYIPETLMQAVQEVEAAYEKYSKDEEFQRELEDLLKHYAGRPSLLYYAEKMTKDLGGARIYLKREDLNHTGSTRLTMCWGRCFWPRKWEKQESLQRPGRDSMGWPPLRRQLLWAWNVKFLWEKRTQTVRL